MTVVKRRTEIGDDPCARCGQQVRVTVRGRVLPHRWWPLTSSPDGEMCTGDAGLDSDWEFACLRCRERGFEHYFDGEGCDGWLRPVFDRAHYDGGGECPPDCEVAMEGYRCHPRFTVGRLKDWVAAGRPGIGSIEIPPDQVQSKPHNRLLCERGDFEDPCICPCDDCLHDRCLGLHG